MNDSTFKPAILVEFIIVAAVVIVLAFVAAPRFSSAQPSVTQQKLLEDLRYVRKQLELYKLQHNGRYPQLDRFAEQMTQCSRPDGTTAPVGTAGYALGPYLSRVPINIYSNGRSIGAGPPGSSDWYYDPNTGVFKANDRSEHRRW